MFSGVEGAIYGSVQPDCRQKQYRQHGHRIFQTVFGKPDNKSIARTICKTRHSITRLAKNPILGRPFLVSGGNMIITIVMSRRAAEADV